MNFKYIEKKLSNKWIQIIISGIIFFFLLAFIFLSQGYSATKEAEEYLNRDNIYLENGNYVIENTELKTKSALIIYPGARVDAAAYLPLAEKISQTGLKIYITKMPLKLAIFDSNAAQKIIENNENKNYYLAGHSLGGAMAASFAANNKDNLSGLILFAAYPGEDTVIKNLPVLSITATNDQIINKEKFEKRKGNLPDDTKYISIEGGNHSQFGSYGFQNKDGKATISREKQFEIIKEEINKFIK